MGGDADDGGDASAGERGAVGGVGGGEEALPAITEEMLLESGLGGGGKETGLTGWVGGEGGRVGGGEGGGCGGDGWAWGEAGGRREAEVGGGGGDAVDVVEGDGLHCVAQDFVFGLVELVVGLVVEDVVGGGIEVGGEGAHALWRGEEKRGRRMKEGEERKRRCEGGRKERIDKK